MYQVPVYKIEREAGLEHALQAHSSIAYASQVEVTDKLSISARCAGHLKQTSGVQDFDLHYLKSILVTTGWNKNDDVFDPIEVWCARKTPEDKPFNYEHDCADIIGHIIDSFAVDAEHKALADTTPLEDLPAKFHIYTPSVLYKYWDKPNLQERMDKLLAEIAQNEWFVSMEALFKGFDYSLMSADGTSRTVVRSEKTAFLTKHLRVYGGDGSYDGQKVGRLLRNITFSGKGLVRKPANPASLILTSANSWSAADLGYLPETEDSSATHMETLMSEQDKRIAELEAEVKALQASLRENDVKQVQAKLDAATVDKAKADETIASLTSQVAELKKLADEAKASLVESQKAQKTAADELATIKAEQKRQTRIVQVKSALKVDESNADAVKAAIEFADSLFDLSDDKFTSHLNAFSKLTPQKTESKTESKTEAAEDETVDEAEGKADAAVLDKTKTEKEAALATENNNSGVEKVQADFLRFFGLTKKE